MEDFRCLDNDWLWIIIIAVFLLLFCNKGCGNSGLGCLFNGLFDGCDGNNNIWIWVIIAVVVYIFFCNNSCGSVFRNDLQ